jgi:hypothetical protein
MERLLANVTDNETVYLKATAEGRLLVSIDSSVGGPASAVDREPIITKYKVKIAFTGASVGDKIVHTRWVDVDGATPTLWAEEWYNDTTRAALASAPLADNLGEAGGGGTADSTATNQLTQITRETEIRDALLDGTAKFQNSSATGTELMLVGSQVVDIDVSGFDAVAFDATYLLTSGNNTYGSFIGSATVSVIVDSLPIQVGFFDSNGFFKRTLDGVVRTGFVGVAGFKTLRITSSITAGSISLKWRKTSGMSLKVSPADKFVAYKFVQSEEISGTTYILKSDGDGWLMTKIVSTTTADTATYAGVGNNASITLATAWANKATLVYGSVAAV